MAEPLSLGGRRFEYVTDAPVRLDLFVMMHARHAGLTGLSQHENETPEAFVQRMLDSCISSGRALLLLGGLLIPEGKTAADWSEEMAFDTAGHLGRIVEHSEKQKVYTELASVLLGFFESGLGSWIGSPRSSGAGAEPAGQKR